MKIFEGSNSQAGQESFVLNSLKEKTNGYYIEIGSNDPFAWSNTYLLETKYNWSGLAFEIEQNLVDSYNNIRKNKCIQADATSFDYLKYFKENNVPKQIDYLQLDIEPARQTLQALYALPLTEYRFSVITFEHDLYADPNNALIKAESEGVLNALGYVMVVENVTDGNDHRPFEDWWIDPSVVI
jgi:hypothetical protein